ncbi:MAG: cytochrome P450 [Pseudomonadales bacterium]|nr:cytochrome P450 [Pseudomonadales bacterium]
MGAEDPSRYEEDQIEFFGYMHSHLMSRRSDVAAGVDVPEDLLTLIASGSDADGQLLSEADAQSVLMQLLVGGNETTTSLITNLLWRLLESPNQWQAMQEDATLIEPAIEESLRFDPPVLGLYRSTTRDVSLHDVLIPKGSKVFINYAAANRDSALFNDPNRFDITRSTRERKRHMSFGLGTHFCLGAPMARLETEIAFQAIMQRLPNLTLIGPGQRIAPFFLWGRRKLPVQS